MVPVDLIPKLLEQATSNFRKVHDDIHGPLEAEFKTFALDVCVAPTHIYIVTIRKVGTKQTSITAYDLAANPVQIFP